VVGVFVDDDVVGVPEPSVAVGEVVGGYAEVEATEPEAGWSASAETPDVRGAEAGGEMTVLPGVVEVVVGIVGAAVVADPVGGIDVGDVGVAGGVGEIFVIGRAGCAVVGFGTMGWGWMRGGSAAGVASSLRMLGQCWG
jgi:hypothetical protein